MMQSKVSVRELAITLRLPYNTMFRLVKRLRGEPIPNRLLCKS